MAELSLAFHPQAEEDVLNGFQWYSERNPGAALAFLAAIEHAGQMILHAPKTWPSHTYGTQKYTVKHFPFKIIYRIVKSEVQIIAVAHDRRRPRYWANRIK